MSETNSIHLTRKERDLLAFLRQNAGKCLSRDVLLRQVWGYREGVKSRTLDVHVQRLRKKLGPQEGARILTVFRGGYLWSNGSNGDLGIAEPLPVVMPEPPQHQL
jgi:DNA-binding response OmpR family regulator